MSQHIRVAIEADAAQILAIYAPFVRDTHTSFELEVPDVTEMARRVRETVRTHPWLVCDAEGEVQGYAYATPFRTRPAYQWGVETTIYVQEGRRGSGLGRLLYRALIRVLEQQGFRMAYAAIALPNAASIGLHESLGFEPVGVFWAAGYKLGRWHDVGWWQRAIAAPEGIPEPVIAFSSLVENSTLTDLLAR